METSIFADENSVSDNLEWQPAQVMHIDDKAYLAERQWLPDGHNDECVQCGNEVARGYTICILSPDQTWEPERDAEGRRPFYCGLACVTEALKGSL